MWDAAHRRGGENIVRIHISGGARSVQLWRCVVAVFFFSSRRRHTRFKCDWSSDVCSSDLALLVMAGAAASSLGRPLALVELQTARVSAWVPLLGVLAAAAALTRGRPATGALALFAVPVLAGLLAPLVRPALARAGFAALPWHAVQAPVLIPLMIAPPAVPTPRPCWVFFRPRPAR